MMDPRPDLKEDTIAWRRLLALAYRINPEVGGVLHGMRCGGLRLKRTPTGRWRMEPEIHPDIGFPTWEEYEEMKTRYLEPHRQTIAALLKRLGEGAGAA